VSWDYFTYMVAGELAVRKSLEYSLRHLGCQVTTITSDEQFHATNLHSFDIIIVDPWTWAAKGD
jgi:DNA-binding response OmpR family regulator